MKTLLAIAISFMFLTGALAAQTTGSASAPAESKPAKAAAFRPTKDQISKGQTMLKDAKLFSGDATGKYDDATRDAIKSYQKANSLEQNGKFDRATLEKMNIALTDKQKGSVELRAGDKTTQISAGSQDSAGSSKSSASATATKAADGPKRPAPFQATKDQIIALQKFLKDGKMFDGATDGERTDALKDSVKKYQEANKLKATGGINSETLQKAGIALTDKQKEQVAAQAAYDAAKPKAN